MSLLDRVRALPAVDLSTRHPFRVDGATVGYVTPDFARHLGRFPDVFRLGNGEMTLAPALRSYADRTRAVNEALGTLAQDGLIPHWRNEPYRVAASFHAPAAFEMERAAVPFFGVEAYGVHVNGYVRNPDEIALWIGRRSADRAVEPGKLDQIVAGGLPAGLDLAQNLIKEGAEEASIPEALMRRARPVGTVSYAAEWNGGLRRDVLFLYDLELPAHVVPRNADGEIAEFALWPVADVIARVRDTDDFKFNCSLVVIDFLVRHGLIGPDEPDYPEIVRGLHR